MSKAFIFDVDGVLFDGEPLWEIEKKKIFSNLFGEDIYKKLGSTVGIAMDGIYTKAVQYGAQVGKDKLVEAFHQSAGQIYELTPLTHGLKDLGNLLKKLGYKIGIVSASPQEWISLVINRLPFKEEVRLVLSLHEQPNLAHKPSPDGYIEAIKVLGAISEKTIILEDSNAGIVSAKAAGAYTIGFAQNLLPGYKQEGADVYAKDLKEVEEIVKNFSGLD